MTQSGSYLHALVCVGSARPHPPIYTYTHMNTHKHVHIHYHTGNVAETLALMLGLVFLDADSLSVYPLSTLQILWINMVTSSPPVRWLLSPPAHLHSCLHACINPILTNER